MNRHIEQHRLDWRGIQLEITYEPQWMSAPVMGEDMAHITVQSIDPVNAKLPITETGYRSHFIAPPAVAETGGPVAYVNEWLEIEADTPAWREREEGARQYRLL